MPKLPADEICRLLQPYLDVDAPRALCERVQRYLGLLEVWNRKLNLTSVREPAGMVQRHFGESFYMARLLPPFQTLLDVGSGAGFPGLPISILHPNADVLLAESQGRKAAFLREAAWMSGSTAKVWPHRVEDMEEGYQFDVVTLRAVDNMQAALAAAMERLRPGGTLALFSGVGLTKLPEAAWANVITHGVPLSTGRITIATLAVPAVLEAKPMVADSETQAEPGTSPAPEPEIMPLAPPVVRTERIRTFEA